MGHAETEHEWPTRIARDELIQQMSEKLYQQVPATVFSFTQPIEMRVDELVAGVKADVAVLLFGDDLPTLQRKGKQIEEILSKIPGAADVKADYQADLSSLVITPRPESLARYGITAKQVLDVVNTLGGVKVGQIFEGRARFPIMVRIPESWRKELDLIKQLPVATIDKRLIPLQELAEFEILETPPSIEHDENRRRTFVSVNVRGRDVNSFVAEAQQKIATEVKLGPGYEVRWGGDFESFSAAMLRLLIITPIVLLLILLLLHTSLGSIRLAMLIYLAVPLATSVEYLLSGCVGCRLVFPLVSVSSRCMVSQC